MNIVDSSGWLEYFADEENATFFAPAIEDIENLLVPAICIYKVFKCLIGQRGENTALVNIGDMHQGQIIDLTASSALQAAKISTDLKIAMADSILLATARTQRNFVDTGRGLQGHRRSRIHRENPKISVRFSKG